VPASLYCCTHIYIDVTSACLILDYVIWLTLAGGGTVLLGCKATKLMMQFVLGKCLLNRCYRDCKISTVRVERLRCRAGVPQTVKRGPGAMAWAGLAHLADIFAERVHEYLVRPNAAQQVRNLALPMLARLYCECLAGQ
jgi:hypothetical protein